MSSRPPSPLGRRRQRPATLRQGAHRPRRPPSPRLMRCSCFKWVLIELGLSPEKHPELTDIR
eukprot:13791099-Alexandrium_andersonii.AAC.1